MRSIVFLAILLAIVVSIYHYKAGFGSITSIETPVDSTGEHSNSAEVLGKSTTALGDYASWEAHEGDGVFALESRGGLPDFSLFLPRNSKHFQISIGDYNSDMPKGNSVPVILSFDDGSQIPLTGVGNTGDDLTIAIPDSLVAEWTHHFTADRTMTVSFPSGNLKPWTYSLEGTTQVVTAMAKGIGAAGITDLPTPWTPAGYGTPSQTSPQPTEQNTSNLTLNVPYGPQDVWTGDPSKCFSADSTQEMGQCIKQTMIASGASPQAVAFSGKFNFQQWLSAFQYEGKVSIGTISEDANDNPDQPVILNAQNPFIEVWGLPDPSDPDLIALKKQHPNASAIHVPMFWREAKTENGGQAFTYHVSLQECGACGGIEYNETIVFDPQGRLVGETVTYVKYDKN